jgi:hypothetical protein
MINVTDLQNKKIHVLINYAEDSHFSINVSKKSINQIIYENQTPFGPQNKIGTEDTRISLIAKYLKDLHLTSDSNFVDIEEYIYAVMKAHQKNTDSA